MPASSLDPMRIPESQKTAKVAPESTLFFVGLQVGAFAESSIVMCDFGSLRGAY
jgi:hypothetical protein